jgi:hypothetical protein
VEDILEQCLDLEYREEAGKGRGPAVWPWVTALVLVAGALGYVWLLAADERHRLSQLDARLRSEPGFVVLDWREEGERVTADLLRDPLAPDPRELVTDPRLRDRVAFAVTPFQSLAPDYVLARARVQLRPPPDVELSLEGGRLIARGSAPPRWLERARASLVLPPGVDALDLAGVTLDMRSLAATVRDALQPPASVTLTLEDKALRLEGTAPWEWVSGVPDRLRDLALLESCDLTGLQIAEWEEARNLAADLEASQVYFVDRVEPVPEAQAELERVAAVVTRLGELDGMLRLGVRIRVVGFSDGLGTERWNRWLRQQRADYVRDALIARGSVPELLAADVDESFRPSPTPVPDLRRVGFSVVLTSPDKPACNP